MENKEIALAKLKNKLRNTSKKQWIAVGVIGGFILLAIICIIISIYAGGSSLGEFFSKNIGWFILGFAVLTLIGLSIVFFKIKKGN